MKEIVKVSIHALRAECDKLISRLSPRFFCFNPRTPCGVRRLYAFLPAAFIKVSIHALRAECDCAQRATPTYILRFNPRTPCGVRQSTPMLNWPCSPFQSTHSVRSATHKNGDKTDNRLVSIHALRAECDCVGSYALLLNSANDTLRQPPGEDRHCTASSLSDHLSIFNSQCVTSIADLPGNSCELGVGAKAVFNSL